VRGLIFDLDGTLIDTAPDMGATLNHLLQQAGRAPLSAQSIRRQVSHGVRGLLRLGFGLEFEAAEYAPLATEFLAYYDALNHPHSRLFDGIEALLRDAKKEGYALAIVTNKPRYLTESLLRVLHLESRFGTVICGDDFSERKPHPRPLFEACKRLGVQPARSFYVGDARRDIEAGNNAGMHTVLVNWGYFDAREDDVEHWPAERQVATAEELLRLLQSD